MSQTLRILFTGLFILLLGLNADDCFAQSVDREQLVDAQGATTLTIHRMNGNVLIQAKDTQSVTVVEKRNATSGTSRKPSANEYLSIQRRGVQIEITSSGEGFRPDAQYVVTMPISLALSVDLYAGNVDALDVQGDVDINSGAGNLSVTRIGARVDLRTGSGNVVLKDIVGAATVNSGAGNVTATHLKSSFTGTTGGGNIDVDDVMGQVKIVTAGGNLGLRNVTGNAQVFSSGGSITALSMKGQLDASTSGGNIQLTDISGETRASTNGGDIRATKISSFIRAETMAGNINMSEVSGGFDVLSEVGDVTIDISDTRFLNKRDASIDSNFGNIRVRIPRSMNGIIFAQVAGNGSIEFKNPGEVAKELTDRNSGDRSSKSVGSVKRSEYQIGTGGGRISLGARNGKIQITIQ